MLVNNTNFTTPTVNTALPDSNPNIISPLNFQNNLKNQMPEISQANYDWKADLNSFVQQSPKTIIRDTYYNSKQYEKYHEALLGKPVFKDPRYYDNEELNSKRQGFFGSLFNGSAKMVGSFGQSFVSTFNPVGYDNETSRAMQEFSQNMENWFPNYYSQAERDNPLGFDGIFSGNFLGDKLFKNIGFMGGAMVAALAQDAILGTLTGGTALAPTLAVQTGEAANWLSKAFKANTIASKLVAAEKVENFLQPLVFKGEKALEYFNNMTKGQKILTGIKTNLFLVNASHGEAAIEALEGATKVKEDLIQQYKEKYGKLPDEMALSKINDLASESGNIRYGLNLATIFLTDTIQFGSLFKPFESYTTGQTLLKGLGGAADRLILDGSGQLVRRTLSKSEKTLDFLTGKLVQSNISEASQEGLQYSFETATHDYAKKKWNGEIRGGIGDYLFEQVNGLKRMFSDEEGKESMLLGFLTGFVAHGFRKIAEKTGKQPSLTQREDQIMSDFNNIDFNKMFDTTELSELMKRDVESFNGRTMQEIVLNQMQDAIKSGNIFDFKSLQHELFFNGIRTANALGKFDAFIEKLDAIKQLAPEEFTKVFGVEVKDMDTVSEYVDKLKDQAFKTKDIIEAVDNTIPNNISFKDDSKLWTAFNDLKTTMSFHLSSLDNITNRIDSVTSTLLEKNPSMTEDLIDKISDVENFNEKFLSPLNQERKTLVDSLELMSQLKEGRDEELFNKTKNQLKDLDTHIDALNKHIGALTTHFASTSSWTADAMLNYKQLVLQVLHYNQQKQSGSKVAYTEHQLDDTLKALIDFQKLKKSLGIVIDESNKLQTPEGREKYLKDYLVYLEKYSNNFSEMIKKVNLTTVKGFREQELSNIAAEITSNINQIENINTQLEQIDAELLEAPTEELQKQKDELLKQKQELLDQNKELEETKEVIEGKSKEDTQEQNTLNTTNNSESEIVERLSEIILPNLGENLFNNINEKINKTKQELQIVTLEVVTNNDLLIYLNNKLEFYLQKIKNEQSIIDKELNNISKLNYSKNTKKSEIKKEKYEATKEKHKELLLAAQDIQDRISEIEKTNNIQKQEIQDLSKKIQFYQSILNTDKTHTVELQQKLATAKTSLDKANRLIEKTESYIDRLKSLLKEIVKAITSRVTMLNDFLIAQNKNTPEFTQNILKLQNNFKNEDALNKTNLLNEYNKLEKDVNDVLDHEEINQELLDKAELLLQTQIEKAIKLQNEIRYLSELFQENLNEVKKENTNPSSPQNKKIVEEIKQEIIEKEKPEVIAKEVKPIPTSITTPTQVITPTPTPEVEVLPYFGTSRLMHSFYYKLANRTFGNVMIASFHNFLGKLRTFDGIGHKQNLESFLSQNGLQFTVLTAPDELYTSSGDYFDEAYKDKKAPVVALTDKEGNLVKVDENNKVSDKGNYIVSLLPNKPTGSETDIKDFQSTIERVNKGEKVAVEIDASHAGHFNFLGEPYPFRLTPEILQNPNLSLFIPNRKEEGEFNGYKLMSGKLYLEVKNEDRDFMMFLDVKLSKLSDITLNGKPLSKTIYDVISHVIDNPQESNSYKNELYKFLTSIFYVSNKEGESVIINLDGSLYQFKVNIVQEEPSFIIEKNQEIIFELSKDKKDDISKLQNIFKLFDINDIKNISTIAVPYIDNGQLKFDVQDYADFLVQHANPTVRYELDFSMPNPFDFTGGEIYFKSTSDVEEVFSDNSLVDKKADIENYFNDNTRSTPNSKYNPDLSGEGELALREQEEQLLQLGADRIQAHGISKGSIGQQFKDLLNILTKGLDKRGGGQLYTAPLVMPKNMRAGAGAALGTGGGTAYIDGGFIILAKLGINEIKSIDDIGGVLVNQAVVDSLPELINKLKQLFPNLSIDSYTNSPKVISEINAKYDAELKALKQQDAEVSNQSEIENKKADIERLEKEKQKTLKPLIEEKEQIEKEIEEIEKAADSREEKGKRNNIVPISTKEAERLLKHLSKKYGILGVLTDLLPEFTYGKFTTEKILINKNTYYDEKGDITFESKGFVNKTTIYHEYLHPFVQILERVNPELYEKIYQDSLSSDIDVSHYIKDVRKEERVVRYLDKLSAQEKTPSLLQQFFDFLSDLFFKNKKSDYRTLQKLNINTTVEELYNIFKNYGNLREGSEKVKEERFLKLEATQLENLINLNAGDVESHKTELEIIKQKLDLLNRYDVDKLQQLKQKLAEVNKKIDEVTKRFNAQIAQKQAELKAETTSNQSEIDKKADIERRRQEATNKVIVSTLSGSRTIPQLESELGKKYDFLDLGNGLVAFTTKPEGTVTTYYVADMNNSLSDGTITAYSIYKNGEGKVQSANKANVELVSKANNQDSDKIFARLEEAKDKITEYDAELAASENNEIDEKTLEGFVIEQEKPVTEYQIPYTKVGANQKEQTYTVKKVDDQWKIFNKSNVEVFKTDSKDRRKIFANLAVKQKRAVTVKFTPTYSKVEQIFIVNEKGDILKQDGDFLNLPGTDPNINKILELAKAKGLIIKEVKSETILKTPSLEESTNNSELTKEVIQPEIKQTKKFNKKNNNSPLLSSKKLPIIQSLNVTNTDIEKVKAIFKGNINVENLFQIANSDAWATFQQSAITLYKGATRADLFHEAWHHFSQLYLTKDEKVRLYGETRDRVKELEGKSDLEVEEYIAREFAKFTETGKIEGKFPERKSIFEKILNFLKSIFSKETDLSFDSLFNNLYKGQINHLAYNSNNILFGKLNSGINDNFNFNDSKLIQSGLDGLFIQVLKDYNVSNAQISKIKNIDRVYDEIYDFLIEQYENSKNSVITSNLERILENWEDVKKAHYKESIIFNKDRNSFEFDGEGNLVSKEENEDDKKGRNKADFQEASEKSIFDIMDKEVKSLIFTLVDKDKKGNEILDPVFGLPKLVDFQKYVNIIAENLSDQNNFNDVERVLTTLSKSYPPMKDLLNSLNLNDSGEVSQLRVKFIQNMALAKHELNIILYNETSKTYNVQGATSNKRKQVENDIITHFVISPATKFIKKINGENQITEAIEYKQRETLSYNIQFIKDLGINLDFLDGLTTKQKDEFVEEFKPIFVVNHLNNYLAEKGVIKDIFKALREKINGNTQEGAFKTLIKYNLNYLAKNTSSSYLNANKKLENENVLWSTLDRDFNSIQNAKSISELIKNPNKALFNPVNLDMNSSVLMNMLFDKKGNRTKNVIKINNYNGLSTEEEGKDGKKTKEVYYTEKAIMDISQFMNRNMLTTMQLSNKATHLSFTLPEPLFNFSYEFEEILMNYLFDELNIISEFDGGNKDLTNLKKVSDAIGTKGNYNLAIFKDILVSDPQTIIDEYLETGNLSNETQSFVKQQIKQFFNQELIATADLLKNDIQKIVPSKSSKYFKEEKFNPETVIEDYIKHQFVFNVELSKIVFGNPYMHKDPHKRIAGATSTGVRMLVDEKTLEDFNKATKETQRSSLMPLLLKRLKLEKINLKNQRTSDKELRFITLKDRVMSFEYLHDLLTTVEEALSKTQENTPEHNKLLQQKIAIQKGYSAVNGSDAMGAVTMDAWRKFNWLAGRWSTELEDIYQKTIKWDYYNRLLKSTENEEEKTKYLISRNENAITEAEGLSISILKYQYYGNVKNDSIMEKAFHKYQLMPLIPQLIEGKLWEHHLDRMLIEDVDYALFDSADKLEKTKNPDDFYNNSEQNNVNTLEDYRTNYEQGNTSYNVRTGYLENLKEQVFMENGTDYSLLFGSQVRKLLFNTEDFSDLYDEFRDAIQQLTQIEKDNLYNKAGLNPEGRVEDKSKFIQFLLDELDKKVVSNNVKEYLRLTKQGEFAGSLDTNLQRQPIERIINSVIQNKIVKQKMHGEMMVQVSNVGFETFGQKDNLKFYTLANGKVRKMEVKVPLSGKFKNLLNLIHSDGRKIETRERLNEMIRNGKIDERAITMIGYRIPTQEHNSVEVMKIQEFLDPISNLIVVPYEITVKAGSDFDIDKLNIFKPHISKNGKYIESKREQQNKLLTFIEQKLNQYENYINKEKIGNREAEEKLTNSIFGELTNLDYTPEEIEDIKLELSLSDVKNKEDLKERLEILKNTKSSYQNRIIEIFEKVLLSPGNFLNLITPNSTFMFDGALNDVFEMRYKNDAYYSKDGKNMPTDIKNTKSLLPRYNWFVFKNMGEAGDGLGIAAVGNTFSQLIQKAKVNFTEDYLSNYSFRFPLKDISSRNLMDGQSKATAYSQLINLLVDVANDPRVGYVNMGDRVIPIINLMINFGIPIKDIVYFINQPIIVDYISYVSKNRKSVVDGEYSEESFSDYMHKVILNHENKDISLSLPEPLSRYKSLTAKELADKLTDIDFSLSKKSMGIKLKEKSQMTEEVSQEQLLILSQFAQMEQIAKDFLQLQVTMNFDTTLVQDGFEAFEKEELFKEIKNKDIFTNLDELRNSTVIAPLNVLKEVVNINQQLLPLANDKVIYNFLSSKLATDYANKGNKTKQKFIRIFKNDFIMYLFQNFVDRNSDAILRFNETFASVLKQEGKDFTSRPNAFGNYLLNNLYKEFAEIKNDPKYRDLFQEYLLLERLFVSSEDEVKNIGLSYFNKDSELQNTYIEQFKELLNSPDLVIKNFMLKFAYMSFYQSGLNKSFISSTDILPVNVLSGILEDVREQYLKEFDTSSKKLNLLGDFYSLMKANNEFMRNKKERKSIDNLSKVANYRGKLYRSDINKLLIEPVIEQPKEISLQDNEDKIQLYGNVYANEGQTSAIQNFREFIKSTNKSFLLKGRGGTGKSTIAGKMLLDAQKEGYYIYGTAISDAATSNLRNLTNNYKSLNVSIFNFASMFGLVPKYDDNGNLISFDFPSKDTLGFNDPKIIDSEKTILVFDEASMVGKDVLKKIKKLIPNSKILYMGDNAQIKPIGDQETISPIFENSDTSSELTEVMRQGLESPILELASNLAKDIDIYDFKDKNTELPLLNKYNFEYFNEDSNSGVLISMDIHDFVKEAVKDFKRYGAKSTIVITGNNDNVEKLNKEIRSKIVSSDDIFVKGERLMTYSKYTKKSKYSDDSIENSSIVYINSAEQTEIFGIPAYQLEVSYTNKEGKEMTTKMNVLLKSDKTNASKLFDLKREVFKQLKAKQNVQENKIKADILNQTIIVDYGYAMTAHKVQGQTVRNSYVYPVYRGFDKEESTRMFYTSITRPTDKLVIFDKEGNNQSNLDKFINQQTTEQPTNKEIKPNENLTPKANIPQNLVSGKEAFGTKQEANAETKKALGANPHSIDMVEAGFRTRTTRSVGEMEKYNVKVGDIVKQFGKSADGTTKNILTRVTAIHPKGTPGFLGTWNKEGWTQDGIKAIERFKDGAAAIEFEVVNQSTEIKPNEYTNHSGGAEGSDIQWDKIGKEFGFVNNKHYWTETKTPHGNTEITKEDFEEGKYESAKAAKRNFGYQYAAMKDSRLIRNWSQVKHSDAVFAIGKIVDTGEKIFPNQKSDTRIAQTPSVTGGTGYAVGMSINHNKPTYVFNQSKSAKYDIGWYKWDGNDFVKIETPILTKNFAGIGTREINDLGKQAIKDVYQKTQNQLTKIKPKIDSSKKIENLKRGDIINFQQQEFLVERVKNEGIDVRDVNTGDVDFISTEDYINETQEQPIVKEITKEDTDKLPPCIG